MDRFTRRSLRAPLLIETVPIIIFVLLSLAGCADNPTKESVETESRVPRHVVLFVIDTLRADRLNCYGYDERMTSPVMDALAAEGVLFESAYSPGPWTLPSLCSIATSSHICEHQVLDDRDRLADDETTMAEYLKAAGFRTVGLFGNGYAGADFGLDQGFDVYEFSRRNDGAKVAAVLDTLESDDRLFLYIHNMEPHGGERFTGPAVDGFPSVPTEMRNELDERFNRYRKLTRWDFTRKQPLGTTDNTAQQQEELDFFSRQFDANSVLYDAAIRLADQRLGSVIHELESRGIWNDTLFLLVSDHGEELGDHGGWQHDQSVYQEMIRVPLIVKLPGNELAGRRVKDHISLVSLLPTILDTLRIETMPMDSATALPLPLAVHGTAAREGTWTVVGMRENRKKYFRPWKVDRGDLNIALRRGSLKGIWNHELKKAELYDLDADPHEHSDLSRLNPAAIEEMTAIAEAWLTTCRASADPAASDLEATDLSQESLDRLRALGYVD